MNRYLEESFSWTEAVMQGRIVNVEEDMRWRPQYFIELETAEGRKKVVLRGFRDPGQLDQSEHDSRARHAREAGLLAALQNTGVPVPHYYGFHQQGGWILMAFLSGTDQFTALTDSDRQAHLFGQYLEAVAKLHALDPAALNLNPPLDSPVGPEDLVRRAYRHRLKAYHETPGEPDPLWTFSLAWLEQHSPSLVERFSICTGDMGVNQFFFEGDTLTAIFDLENTYISDPLRDIGMMRYRDMLYPFPGLAEQIRYFGEISGRCVTDQSLHFWTILGMLGSSPAQRAKLQTPDPLYPREQSLLLAMTPLRRRGCTEAFHHMWGWELPARPACPPLKQDRLTKFPRFVQQQLEQYYLPRANESDRYTLTLTTAHAAMAVLANGIGPEITVENIADLEQLLGHRPESELAGLAELDERILQWPEQDLRRFFTAMYRIECRNEYLYEPIIHATGLAFGYPLQKI